MKIYIVMQERMADKKQQVVREGYYFVDKAYKSQDCAEIRLERNKKKYNSRGYIVNTTLRGV